MCKEKLLGQQKINLSDHHGFCCALLGFHTLHEVQSGFPSVQEKCPYFFFIVKKFSITESSPFWSQT
jgi:hypothetical protein